jgi:hypothetical protein
MNFNKLEITVKDYLKNKDVIEKATFYSNIGVTYQGLRDMYKFKRMMVKTLEAIAKELGVSPCIFLENGLNYTKTELHPANVSEPGNGYTPNKCKELNDKLQRLENELRLKDDLIKTYHQLISSKGMQ